MAVYIGDGFSPPQIEADLRGVESRSRSGIVLIAVDSADRVRHAGATALVLSTQPSQQAAHHLYERLGFHRDADRDWRTATGGQRLVYVMRLEQ